MARKSFIQRLGIHRHRTWPQILAQQFVIGVGAALAALGYVLFQVPFDLAAGGVSGLGIIINHFTGLPVGTLFLLINIPLLVLGFHQLGRWRFLFNTVLSVVVFSVASDLFLKHLPETMRTWPLTDDPLLSAIYAGIVYGLGSGLVYRAGGTVGGTSVPARILHIRRGFPMSQSYMFTDLAVIVLAGLVFSWEQAMLALLSLGLTGMFSDFVLEGISYVRTAMIITNHPRRMSKALMAELSKGVSLWPITGAYTEQSRTMIYCTIRRSQITELKQVVSREDPKAFLVIGVAQQAFGGVGFAHLEPARRLPERDKD
jgi:uncharacterized membrane-anchored protein YitT (DUF2179 family)